MKFRTLAVLAFAGVLSFSGAAFAKAITDDPDSRNPTDEIRRIRERFENQNNNQSWPPVFRPGADRWPDRSKDGVRPYRPVERPKDDRYDRKPPEPPKDGVRPNRPPEKPKDDRSDDRPHPLPRDGHKRKVPPEYKD